MPQTQLPAPADPSIGRLHLARLLLGLGRLASDPARAAWGQHLKIPSPADASAERVEKWYVIAKEGIQAFDGVYRRSWLWPYKEEIYQWLSRKYDVLLDALKRDEILPIDVLDAVVSETLV